MSELGEIKPKDMKRLQAQALKEAVKEKKETNSGWVMVSAAPASDVIKDALKRRKGGKRKTKRKSRRKTRKSRKKRKSRKRKRKSRKKRGGKDNMCSNYYYKKHGNTEQQSNFEHRDDVTQGAADEYCATTNEGNCNTNTGKCRTNQQLETVNEDLMARLLRESQGGKRRKKKSRKRNK